MKVLPCKVYIYYISHKIFYGVAGIYLFGVRFKLDGSTQYYHVNCVLLSHISETP